MTEREHRRTALLVGAVLGGVACWSVFRRHEYTAVICAATAFILFAIGLFLPAASKAFHEGWMRLAGVLGYVNSRILMSLAFFLLITPVAVFMRLLGRDMLEVRGRGDAETYWKTRTRDRTTASFEKAF